MSLLSKSLALLCMGLALPCVSIELSLEENKAERGSIGYIDMQRLFKQFPETLRAKENFEELMRQAEEQLNLRKTEVLRLRNEISQLRIQRDFLAKTPIVTPTAPEPPAPAKAQRDQESETDLTRPSLANLPGFSSSMSTPTITAEVAVTTAPALSELDARIELKSKELQTKELEFQKQQAASEKDLLDLESRKTGALLGKIHQAVQAVARREGISVVVDKSSILFGHDAVDLTDKVMKYLKGS